MGWLAQVLNFTLPDFKSDGSVTCESSTSIQPLTLHSLPQAMHLILSFSWASDTNWSCKTGGIHFSDHVSIGKNNIFIPCN